MAVEASVRRVATALTTLLQSASVNLRRLTVALVVLVGLAGCGSDVPPPGANGQQVNGGGGGGGNGVIPSQHGCGEPVDSVQDSKEMASWVHWMKTSWAGFAPDDKWSVVQSTAGVDVTAPLGVAGAGFGFVSNTLTPSSPEQIEQLTLDYLGATDVQILNRSATVPLGGGDCQEIEFTGSNGGGVHGRIAVVVFNNAAVGMGYSFRAETARADLWPQYARTLQLINDHITYQGRPPGTGG